MTDAAPGPRAANPDDQHRPPAWLVSSLRAHGGLGAVAAACHHALTEVDGVVLIFAAAHAGRIILSDSGPHGDQLEDLHATLGEGPFLDVARTGEPVAVLDLDRPPARSRWPRFAEQATACGVRAIFARPVLLNARPIGVLSAYRVAAGPLSAADHERLRRYGNAIAVVLLDNPPATSNGTLGPRLPIRAGQVQQAVGIVMEYADVDATTALHRLRAYAWRSARPMHEVVADVRTNRLPFDPTEAT